jgi:hypothetical protein
MAECLLELDLGSAALEEVTGAVVDFTDAVASADVAALTDAAALRADLLVVDSTVVAVGTSAEQVAADSTAVEARSTAEVAADSTAVEEAMAAGTGN